MKPYVARRHTFHLRDLFALIGDMVENDAGDLIWTMTVRDEWRADIISRGGRFRILYDDGKGGRSIQTLNSPGAAIDFMLSIKLFDPYGIFYGRDK